LAICRILLSGILRLGLVLRVLLLISGLLNDLGLLLRVRWGLLLISGLFNVLWLLPRVERGLLLIWRMLRVLRLLQVLWLCVSGRRRIGRMAGLGGRRPRGSGPARLRI
jgi:hypothetical protein